MSLTSDSKSGLQCMRPTFIKHLAWIPIETVWPSRMCWSIPWLMTLLKCLNPSAGNLPYIPNFENKGTWYSILRRILVENLFKFVLDYKFGTVPCTYSLFRNQSKNSLHLHSWILKKTAHSYFAPAPLYHVFPALSDSSLVCHISRCTDWGPQTCHQWQCKVVGLEFLYDRILQCTSLWYRPHFSWL